MGLLFSHTTPLSYHIIITEVVVNDKSATRLKINSFSIPLLTVLVTREAMDQPEYFYERG